MILILSPTAEKTTNDVMDWLIFGVCFTYRITENSDCFFVLENEKISIIDVPGININSIWTRKGHVNIKLDVAIRDIPILDTYLQKEFKIFSDFVIKKLEQKPHIGNYFEGVPNKILHLEYAKKVGLAVPKTLITSEKSILVKFKQEHRSIITKSIKDSFSGTFDGVYYYNHTEKVSEEAVEQLQEKFFPTLFQEEIPKIYELRVVFVHNAIWACAIMSQNDKKTALDWRNYNEENPNRIIPYQLPSDIEHKILAFAKMASLNTGAIDMIVSKDRQYVFLECNPNGQISMVSQKCNYPIEKFISDFLSNPI